MLTVKTRIQGNATVITIPKSLNIPLGTEFIFSKGKDNVLTLTPTKKAPTTLAELFDGWEGKYEMPDDMKDWENMQPVGKESW